ncbi:MAG TPA: hypothetical protein VF029_04090 [Actinomycetota bacterium]
MEPDRGRSQRIAAGAVAIGFFVGAVWLVTTGGPYRSTSTPTPTPTPTLAPAETPAVTEPADRGVTARVGFVGLPPQGAAPSRPRRGELVLSYFGRQFAHWYQVWVYGDGRMIWQREGDVREGANEYATGFLEQRLTPEGVGLLRAQGSAESALFGFPWRPPYPASWLPPRAWEDREIRPYVPPRYAVCYRALRSRVDPARILTWLPTPAAELLGAGVFDVRSRGLWLRGFDAGCSALTTEDARAVARALEDAGHAEDEFQNVYGLTYYVDATGPVGNDAVIRFEPILPHGEVGCSGCG